MLYFDINLLINATPFLFKGALYTVKLSFGGMIFGLLLGFLIAICSLYAGPSLRYATRSYVSFVRGTPLLVQLFIIYYGLPQFGLSLDPVPSALIGFTLNVGGYTSEIWRAAIGSVDHGQTEAAASLGMTPLQAMVLVIIPQALRLAAPPLGNTFMSLVKDTALAATIQVPELFRQAQLITARTYQIFTMYLGAAALYWVLSAILGWVQRYIERRTSLHLQKS